MSKRDIIRAWKDEAYRNSLSEAERAQLPENPAGAVELFDTELDAAAGGASACCLTMGCCGGWTSQTDGGCGTCRDIWRCADTGAAGYC